MTARLYGPMVVPDYPQGALGRWDQGMSQVRYIRM